jgi:hypothetical protein
VEEEVTAHLRKRAAAAAITPTPPLRENTSLAPDVFSRFGVTGRSFIVALPAAAPTGSTLKGQGYLGGNLVVSTRLKISA